MTTSNYKKYLQFTIKKQQNSRQKIDQTRKMNGWFNTDVKTNLFIIFMISEQIPKQLNYQTIIPKGFPSVYKQWQLDPMTSNKQWANNDIVRFSFMNVGSGVFDPFRSYIEITVSTNSSDHGVGLLQIDNSAQSFINQTVLYSNNREIERITQYSTIAAYLNDIGLTQYISEGRQAEGFGYGSFDTMPFSKGLNSNGFSIRSYNGQDSETTVGTGNIFPTIGNMYPKQQANINQGSITNAGKTCKGHYSNSNINLCVTQANTGSGAGGSAIASSLAVTGYANNIRSQYQTNFVANKYPQATSSIPNYELLLDQSVANSVYPFYYNQNIPYEVGVRTTLTDVLTFGEQTTTNQTQTINCANFGFTSLFSPQFTKGGFQPFISSTIPQSMMLNGNIQLTKFPIYKKKFKIPLISGVMGVLIQQNQFILVPLKSINSCMLQITLDPYAMFTSGYCDVSEMDTQGINVQQKRNYHIQRIKYKLQTYHFIDRQLEVLLQMSLTKQIILTSPFWQLGNQYQVAGGAPINNNYIVGLSSTHLNEIACLFVSNDYQTYSFARRHYRLSNNIRKFWSKIAVDYWPPQPYKGNGGNINSNNEDDDNSNYVENIYWTNGYMFSKYPLPRINQYNFSLNSRVYDVTNKSTMYDVQMLNNGNYVFTSNSINADTAMGMSWLHENRCIGRAAYVISYTPFSNKDTILQGINISGVNNFEVLFDQDSTNTFPRDQTLYIYGRSSVVVKYTKDGIQTYGR